MKKTLIVIIALSSLILSIQAVIHKIGGFQGDPLLMRDICINDGKAYLTDGYSIQTNGFIILDISNPTSPNHLGSGVSDSDLREIAVYGQRAYIAARENGVEIWDVSNPQQPIFLSSLPSIYACEKLTIAGNRLYLAVQQAGLLIYNIANPTPQFVGSYASCNAYDVEVRANIAYVADFNYGLRILNVSDPNNCQLLGSYNSSNAKSLAVSGNLLFITDNFLHHNIIDVSNPSDPNQLSSISDMWVGASTFYNNYLFLSINSPGTSIKQIKVYNITNTSSPSLASSYTIQGLIYSMVALDDNMYVPTDNHGLHVLDISDMTNSSLIATSLIPTNTKTVENHGNYAYLADNDTRLIQLDVSDPAEPALVSEFPFTNSVSDLVIIDRTAYVAANEAGLYLFRLTEPDPPAVGNIQMTSSIPAASTARSVWIDNNVAYVANDNCLQIIDVSHPLQLSVISQLQNASLATGCYIAKYQDCVYIASWTDHITIVNVSDLNNPQIINSINFPSIATELLVNNGYLYLSCYDSVVRIYNLSNPGTPILANAIMPRPGGKIGKIYVWDQYLFVPIWNWNEIVCYNIANPAQTDMVRDLCWNLQTYDMYYSNGYLFTCNAADGFSILDFDVTEAIDDEQVSMPVYSLTNYPNPFYAETMIKYNLPTKGKVELNIYNIRGQVIRHLLFADLNAGAHTINWDGRTDNYQKAACGIYISRMLINGKQEYRKIVLIK